MELGDTGKVEFLTVELLNSSSLSCSAIGSFQLRSSAIFASSLGRRPELLMARFVLALNPSQVSTSLATQNPGHPKHQFPSEVQVWHQVHAAGVPLLGYPAAMAASMGRTPYRSNSGVEDWRRGLTQP